MRNLTGSYWPLRVRYGPVARVPEILAGGALALLRVNSDAVGRPFMGIAAHIQAQTDATPGAGLAVEALPKTIRVAGISAPINVGAGNGKQSDLPAWATSRGLN